MKVTSSYHNTTKTSRNATMYLSSTMDCVLELKTDKIKALRKFQSFPRKNGQKKKKDPGGAAIPFFTVPRWEALPLEPFSVILVWRLVSVEFPLSAVVPALQVRI